MKKCVKCESDKALENFANDKYKKDGKHSVCKDCRKEYLKAFYADPEKRAKKNAIGRAYHHENFAAISVKSKERYERDIEKHKARRKAVYWKDPEGAKLAAKTYSLKRRWEDPVYRMVIRCRKRVWEAYSAKGYTKRSKTFELIGCSHQELRSHLESMFSHGMDWENYGLWHVDHIIPLASAKTEEEVADLCHFKNLQPLWAADNIKKGARIDYGNHPATS